MKLKTTSDCKLILEGAPKSGKELLLYNYETIISINREEDKNPNLHIFEMNEDGLYQYYLLEQIPEDVTDLVDYINDYQIDPQLTDEGKPAEVFIICNLRNCLINKEKNMINTFLKDCGGKAKCGGDSNKQIDDFLLISVFLLENLICRGNYVDAIRILKGISGCNGICGENDGSKKCNCCG